MKLIFLLLALLTFPCNAQNKGVFSTYDADAQDYFDRVAAAGGTLSDASKSNHVNFVRQLKADGNWTGFDICTFSGGFNGCFVKLGYINASYKNLINTSFVSGDYAAATGLTNSGGTKKFDSQIIPNNEGLGYNNIYFSVFLVDQVSTGTFVAGEVQPNSGLGQSIFLGKTNIGMNSGGTATAIPDYGTGTDYFLQISAGPSEVVSRRDWHDLLPPSPNATSAPSVTMDQSLTGSQTRNFGTNVNGTGSYAMYMIGPYRTRTQMESINRAVRKFLVAEGRIIEKDHCVLLGDSNTKGEGASPESTNRYSKLLAAMYGLQERNMGISGTRLTGTTTGFYSGMDRWTQILLYNVYRNGKVIINYGTNDMGGDPLKGTTGTASLVTTYTSNLVTIVTGLINGGVPSQNIIICSPVINSQPELSTACKDLWTQGARQAVLNLRSNGIFIRYFDATAYLNANGGNANLDGSGVHLSNTGHLNEAIGIYTSSVYITN